MEGNSDRGHGSSAIHISGVGTGCEHAVDPAKLTVEPERLKFLALDLTKLSTGFKLEVVRLKSHPESQEESSRNTVHRRRKSIWLEQ